MKTWDFRKSRIFFLKNLCFLDNRDFLENRVFFLVWVRPKKIKKCRFRLTVSNLPNYIKLRIKYQLRCVFFKFKIILPLVKHDKTMKLLNFISENRKNNIVYKNYVRSKLETCMRDKTAVFYLCTLIVVSIPKVATNSKPFI